MESEPMPSSLAVLTSPRHTLLDAVPTLNTETLMSFSAVNIQLVATQSGLEEVLRLAHDHVDNVMAQHAGGEMGAADLDGEGYAMLATPKKKTMSVAATVSRIISSAVRILRRNACGDVGGGGAFLMIAASEAGEARYKRLKAGFTKLKQHMQEVEEHREQLHRALDQLGANTMSLQDTSASLMKLRVSSSINIPANLSESCAAIDCMKIALDEEVSDQTSRKLAQLQLFEEKLEVREQLRHQVDVTEQQLQTMRVGICTSRTQGHRATQKRFATMREITAKRQEFQRLRRRLAVMTEALERVFQFHFLVDQYIAEPELETVHKQLQSFFLQNQRTFEAMQPKL